MVIDVFAYFGYNNNKFLILDPQFILTFDDPPFLTETKKGRKCINLHFLVCFLKNIDS